MKKYNFSKETLDYLENDGWNINRNSGLTLIELPKDFIYPEFVLEILSSFGGLEVGEINPGVNVIKNKIFFNPIKAELENEDDGIFKYYSNLLNITLYPIGIISDQDLYLAIDEQKKLYVFNDWMFLIGNSFEIGLHNLLTGIKGKEFNEETLEWEGY